MDGGGHTPNYPISVRTDVQSISEEMSTEIKTNIIFKGIYVDTMREFSERINT